MQSKICDKAIAQFIPNMPMMGAAETREKLQYLRETPANWREVLLSVWIRRGWKAVGYSTFEECYRAEILPFCPEIKLPSERHLYRLARAKWNTQVLAKNMTHGSNTSESAIPERILRELDRLPYASDKRKVWRQCQALNGELTSEVARKLVDAWLERFVPKAQPKPKRRKRGRPRGPMVPAVPSAVSRISPLERHFKHLVAKLRDLHPQLGDAAVDAGAALDRYWRIVEKACCRIGP